MRPTRWSATAPTIRSASAAAELQCRVIGEGANLGMTQRGRIEASLRGIKLNTDAIDNSAGVNTSDVEVNIKIALSGPVRSGALTRERRNALLAEMTGEVAGLVLRNNYQQTLALSLAERRGLEDLGFQQRLMHTLETRGELDRVVEFLPDDLEIAERRKLGGALTRPELAVLLAYAKLALKDELLESTVPDEPYLGRELGRYFPPAVSERFPDAVAAHRLRREIIVTQLANSMINRGGPTLVVRIADQTGATAVGIASAFAVVRDSFGMTALNGEIDALDGRIAGKLQLDLYAAVQDLLLDRIVWFLRNVDLTQGLAAVIAHYRGGIETMRAALVDVLPPDAAAARDARAAELNRAGVPDDLARRLADLPLLAAAPDVVLVADRTGKPVAEVAATYFAAGAFFKLDRIVGAARGIQVADYFDRLALDRALDSIGAAERRLAAEMVANGHAGAEAVETWVAPRAAPTSIASAPRSTRSRAPASPCPSSRWPQACWAIWCAGLERPPRRAIVGWVLFDWAAQPFFTLVTTFVYAPYFAATVVADPVEGQALWGYAKAASGLVIALLSPVLGAIADASGRRKPWIAVFGTLLVVGSAALWLGKPGEGALAGARRVRGRRRSGRNSPPCSTTP